MKRNILKNMTAAIAALFIALLALPQTAKAQSKEAYVVEDGSTLTFYYDTNKATRTTGTVYGINDKRKDDTKVPAWAGTTADPNERITKVVFNSSFKDYKPATTHRWFYYCKNLATIEGFENLNTEEVTDMSRMFQNCESLEALDVSKFNTEKVVSMYSMFRNCSSLTSLNLSSFNTENVTDMGEIFSGCKSLTSLNVSKFNTKNVTNMYGMFYKCKALTSIDVTNFNTVKVTNMCAMFSSCSSLTSLDVSKFNTANVTNMRTMFDGCSSLKSLDVTNFNTGNVTDMCYMFCDCSSLPSLDVSNFNTKKVTAMTSMFFNCSDLTTIYCNDDWNKGVVAESKGMFYDCPKLKGAATYDQTKADVTMANPTTGYFTKIGEITPVAYVVEYDGTLTFYYDTEKNTRIGYIYDINQKNDANVPIWAGKDNITKVVFDKLFKDYRPTTTASWFYSCKNLDTVEGIEYLNTEEVNDMSLMFAVCNALTALDVSKFNTAKVTNMSGMFGESALTTLDLTSFNTANVTDMSEMFAFCDKLTSLDLSMFNTAKVTNMMSMFWACEALTTIYCNDDWTKGVVTESENMFADCTKLKGAVSYDQTKTDVTMANPTTGYFTRKNTTGIDAATVDTPAARRGIYTLNGVRLNTSPDNLPAGIYVIDGRKVVKR